MAGRRSGVARFSELNKIPEDSEAPDREVDYRDPAAGGGFFVSAVV
jgi:hypothetical protein